MSLSYSTTVAGWKLDYTSTQYLYISFIYRAAGALGFFVRISSMYVYTGRWHVRVCAYAICLHRNCYSESAAAAFCWVLSFGVKNGA